VLEVALSGKGIERNAAIYALGFYGRDLPEATLRQPDDWDTQRSLTYLPRIVCRLARGPIPKAMLDGLRDPNPGIRRLLVQAFELSGNLEAVPIVEPLTRDSDPATREAAQAALRALGPATQ
jgi:hypothetical protein